MLNPPPLSMMQGMLHLTFDPKVPIARAAFQKSCD